MPKLDTEELEALRSSVKGLLDRHSHPAAVRQLLNQESPTASGPLWSEMAALGWQSLLVPEEFGGADAGVEAALTIVEGLGAHTTPSPFLASAVVATWVLANGASATPKARWLPQLAEGSLVAGLALGPIGERGRGSLGVTAQQGSADDLVLDGVARYGLDVNLADVIVAAGADPATGEAVVVALSSDTPGLTVTRVPSVDETRSVGHVAFHGVHVPAEDILSRGAAADALIDGAIDIAGLALAADALGAAKRTLDMSVEYAKTREQFGRPIGSFQAIKHKLADMFLLAQGCDASVEAAAQALDRDPSTARKRVAVVGSFCRLSAVRIAGDAMQAHGGIGFTWEHDCHLLLKRSEFDQVYLTDVYSQFDRLVETFATN